MANQQAWNDRKLLLDLYGAVRQNLNAMCNLSDQIQGVKDAIIADTERTAQFTQLMLEDPNLTTEQVLGVIAQIKVMADYVKASMFYDQPEPPEEPEL